MSEKVDGDALIRRARAEKAKLTRVREGLQILGTLIIFGVIALVGIRFAVSTADPAAEPAVRVEMWCTGYAAGFTKVMTRAGFSPPYSNEWERLIKECTDGIFYLDPYDVQRGISPLNPSEILWEDQAPQSGTQCLPSILRQC